MKLKGAILLSLSAALVIIGTHLTMVDGITLSYPVFMAAVALLFWYKYIQHKQVEEDKNQQPLKKLKPKDRLRK
jgi:hypothetical protein